MSIATVGRVCAAAWMGTVVGCASASSESPDAGSQGSGSSAGASSGASSGSGSDASSEGASGSSSEGEGGSSAGTADATTEAPPGSDAAAADSTSGSPLDASADVEAGAETRDSGVGTPVEGGVSWSGPTVAGTVTVTPGTTAGHVGPGFVGLSFEKSNMTDRWFTGDNAPLIALFKLLGPSVVRIGANDVDRMTWVPTAMPVSAGPPFPTTVGTVEVDELADFLKATGWRVIYGVNFKTGTAANSAEEAAYAAQKLGSCLYGFEIGNEINLNTAPYPDVKTKWESFAAAIRASAPDAQLIGPATSPSGLAGYAVPFAHDEASKIVLLTHHYYRLSSSSPNATMATLLSPDPGLISALQTLNTAATSNHIRDGYRIGETASFSGHGAPGVSDALGSALWALDVFFDYARNGSQGVNFHGGATGMDGTRPFYYSPIGELNGMVTEARPVFYGMLLMTLAGTGTVLPTTATAGTLNFSAYALAAADGSTNVILVNKDVANGVKASVDLGAAVGSASAIYLQGPSPPMLAATSGVTLAGAGISPAGAWSPRPPYALPVSGNTVTVLVPAASAALVRVP